MNLFESLVRSVTAKNHSLTPVLPVVKKEILHQEIIREMADCELLNKLVFMGGTCLRTCYDSPRLSEDIDFTTVSPFPFQLMQNLGEILKKMMKEKYDFSLSVLEPKQDSGDTRTWKITIITRPEEPHLPAQRIHIDICSVPSIKPVPVMLKDPYQIHAGSGGIILQAESKEEIMADKWLALALRPNRVKQRDLWDIQWLNRTGTVLVPELLLQKLHQREIEKSVFLEELSNRLSSLKEGEKDFLFEMQRFLSGKERKTSLEHPDFWQVMLATLFEGYEKLKTI
jgi:predicted nucleotidyltransferase component of viral defense system